MSNSTLIFPPLPSSGGGGGVSSLNTITGAINLLAGTGITVTPSGQNITIASTGSSLFVPYTGAVSDVDLNQHSLTNASSLAIGDGSGNSLSMGFTGTWSIFAQTNPFIISTDDAFTLAPGLGNLYVSASTLQLDYVSTPGGAPPGGSSSYLYFKTDGNLYKFAATGGETLITGGANTALSNLASTAINASLLFGTDALFTIGSSLGSRPSSIFLTSSVTSPTAFLGGSTTSIVSGDTLIAECDSSTGGSSNIVAPRYTTIAGAAASVRLLRARGSNTAPSAVLSGDSVATLSFGGYDGTIYKNSANIVTAATENFVSGSNHGTSVTFNATATGSNNASVRLALTGDGKVSVTPNLAIITQGSGLQIAEGTNARMGAVTLVAGTLTVANTSVTASTRIFLTVQSLGTIAVPVPIAVTSRVNGTSFTIISSSITDTSVIAYQLVEAL